MINESNQTPAVARVLLFAYLKQVAGQSEFMLPVAQSLTVDELWERLIEWCPGLAVSRRVVRLSRNGEYATTTTRFEPGDEVALIPPVSGG